MLALFLLHVAVCYSMLLMTFMGFPLLLMPFVGFTYVLFGRCKHVLLIALPDTTCSATAGDLLMAQDLA